jgi:hypothetical protein
VIVHSGRAVFNTIAGSPQISGTDVILAHRLLKNSIPSSEYLLMTESAYRDLGHEMPGKFIEGRESYAEVGSVKMFVRYLGEVKERHRDAMYAMSRGDLTLRAERYVLLGGRGPVPGRHRTDAQSHRRCDLDQAYGIRAPVGAVIRLHVDRYGVWDSVEVAVTPGGGRAGSQAGT